MSRMSREECIELGVSVPTDLLTDWASEQLAAADGREERLQRRGIRSAFLREIRTLIGTVTEAQSTLGLREGQPPPAVVDAQRLCEEALADWKEAKHIVHVEFGSPPELLVKCRRGVRVSLLIAHLTRELDCVVSLIGDPSAGLGPPGVRATMRKLGGVLIGKLKEAQRKLDAVCSALPPVLAEQCRRKGRLYELTRSLARIGRLEFLNEPEAASLFNGLLSAPEAPAGRTSGPGRHPAATTA